MTFTCLSQEEIRRKYIEADDKNHIIDVIAGLTCGTRKEVEEFLCLDGTIPKMRKPKVKLDVVEARRLYDAGLLDQQIANVLNVTKVTVGTWRRGEGLPLLHSRAGNEDERLRLHGLGLNDAEISAATEYTRSAIFSWRKRRGLPANTKRGGYHRKKRRRYLDESIL